ncbi:MAG: WcaF family extracellular polysaccharide biosynthesis acetyltransferase [Bacteroidota bacterium]|nr:WcaF family extracellular polysaccharide biosynthesis acetyltransferase [Bacteroidota bacterium]
MQRVDLSTYNNSWYNPGNAIKRLLWFYINALIFKSDFIPINFIKIATLRAFGAKVGKSVTIKPAVNIKYPWHLTIGNHVWIGENVWLDSLGEIIIADNVCISQGALILTGNHNYKSPSFDLIIKPVELKEGVWIGAKSIVCPGVVCHSHAVLTVGSVANKDMDAYYIYTGVPASKVRQR